MPPVSSCPCIGQTRIRCVLAPPFKSQSTTPVLQELLFIRVLLEFVKGVGTRVYVRVQTWVYEIDVPTCATLSDT